MSDFISNLITRHSQTEGNVTPRVRGRFESERNPAGFAPDESNTVPDWTDSDSLLNRPNRQPQFFDNQYINDRKQPDREAFLSVRSVMSNPFSRAERDRPIEPKPQPDPAAQPTAFLPGNSLFNPTKNRRNEETREPVGQGMREPDSAENQRVISVMPVFENQNAPESKGFNTRSGGLLGKLNRLPEFRQNSVENRAEQAPTAPAQPSINVTIGRIDVRAMPSPNSAPTPAKAAPKPQLSLDDYLKQRNNRPT